MRQENFIQQFGRIVVILGIGVITVGYIIYIFFAPSAHDGIFKDLVAGSGYVIGGLLLWGIGKIIFLLQNIYDAIESSSNRF